MSLIWKTQELRVNTFSLNCRKHLQSFADWYSKVEVAVNHKDRCLEVVNKLVWRPAVVHRRITPWRTLEFPLGKPQFLSGAVHTREVVHTIM